MLFLECWAHEESKGWRFVNVNAEVLNVEVADETLQIKSSSMNDGPNEGNHNDESQYKQISTVEEKIKLEKASDKETDLIDLNESRPTGRSKPNTLQSDQTENKDELEISEKDAYEIYNIKNLESQRSVLKTVKLVKTSCGDSHNIGLDIDGRGYSLPSPLDFDPFPSGSTHKVRIFKINCLYFKSGIV